ncbi:hypothetical protein C8F04DRAFT_1273220 [Mycena alexandri]|uniref:Uncharacterized protein n=1 Tax=Mycena alexandri TaxID=1745969 RepID=A0AAD6S5V4_9AGAR|nr:hypothetical protein C8F04DRAFT_1273220 [Mycena alexandri]
MTSRFPSTVVNKGPSWQRFDGFTLLVVFGASYCDVGYFHRDSPAPSAEGWVQFSTSTKSASWTKQSTNVNDPSAPLSALLVYNYARGGSRVPDVKRQIQYTVSNDTPLAKGNKPNYIAWNVDLQRASSQFAMAHPDATVLIYSSYDTFSAILDDPVAYGFAPQDAVTAGGPMWVDHLHPTSKVHGFIGRF